MKDNLHSIQSQVTRCIPRYLQKDTCLKLYVFVFWQI